MKRPQRPSVSLCATLVLAAVAGLACAGSPQAERRFAAYPQARVLIESEGGTHAIQAWIADTPARREQGLMFVERLEAGRGMLFLFDAPQFAAFWMKDTPASLDILFIDQDGHITNIGERTRPFSTVPIPSLRPIVAVLELAAGTTARLGVRAGDRVIHPGYGEPPSR